MPLTVTNPSTTQKDAQLRFLLYVRRSILRFADDDDNCSVVMI